MTTALGIIKSAMRKIGVLTKGEAPSDDEADDALETLNDMLASWSNDSMTVNARTLESFTLTANDGEYTIGLGANFNTTRPVRIVSAYIRSGTIDYPIDIINDEKFAKIGLKSTGGIPEFLNFDNAYSTATIKLYPVPASGYTLYLLTEKPLSTFTLNQTVDLPPGWKRGIIYSLALELATEYGQPVTQEIFEIAKDAKAEIRRAVLAAKKMEFDTSPGASGNIYNGWTR